eukprot:TRINITY_DN19281_c0_g2_i1.p1 TRINITY_DN19281_c0_g2~~TRINITY_DN19281_c0_g2_i1.p1  ORF type:complete len:1024 (+),score=227.47 TRINITY_DN19281_c0_g2_i1:121-3192(+)
MRPPPLMTPRRCPLWWQLRPVALPASSAARLAVVVGLLLDVADGVLERCPPGHFSSTLQGDPVCEACAAGKFSNATTPANTCQQCPPATYSDHDATEKCTYCPAGRYNPLEGQLFCSNCPPGADCVTEDEIGSAGFEVEEFYYFMGTPEPGDQAFTKAVSKQVSKPGWTEVTTVGLDGVGPFRCPAQFACLGGNDCSEGNTGPMCGSCKIGYDHATFIRPCGTCPHAVLTVSWFIAYNLGYYYLVAWGLYKKHAARGGQLKGLVSVVIKVMLRWSVLFALVNEHIEVHNVFRSNEKTGTAMTGAQILRWPVLGSLEIAKSLKDPSKAGFSTKCFFEDMGSDVNYHAANVAYAWLQLPGLLLFHALVGFIWILITKVVGEKPIGSFKSLMHELCEHATPVAIIVLYLAHPGVTSNFLKSFDCAHFDDETGLKLDTPRLLMDTSVDCYSEAHVRVQTAAAMGVIFYGCGIPALLGFVLWYQKSHGEGTLTSPKIWTAYGFLMDGYEPDCYYYDSVYMVRRVCILCATHILSWLSHDARTVVMLAFSLYFLAIHLNDRPYDNRAYSGVDHLETAAIFTFIFLILGNLFEVVFLKTKNSVGDDEGGKVSKLVYLLGFGMAAYTVSFAAYLAVRSVIWPKYKPSPIRPQWLRAWLDGRAHFTFMPASPAEMNADPITECFMLSSASLNELTAGEEKIERRKLPKRELEAITGFFGEVVELVVQRHESCQDEAPDVIFLPSLLTHVERIASTCMCVALKERVKAEESKQQLDTVFKMMMNVVQKKLEQLKAVLGNAEVEAGSTLMEKDPKFAADSEDLDQYHDLLSLPVTAEEMHTSLMTITPLLLDPSANKSDKILWEFAKNHQGILDKFANVSWLFKPQAHLERIARYRGGLEEVPSSGANGELVAKVFDEFPPSPTGPPESGEADLLPPMEPLDEPLAAESRRVQELLEQARKEREASDDILKLARKSRRETQDTMRQVQSLGHETEELLINAEEVWQKITEARQRLLTPGCSLYLEQPKELFGDT